MRRAIALTVVPGLLAIVWMASPRRAAPRPPAPRAEEPQETAAVEAPSERAAPARETVDIAARLARFEGEEIARLEEEWEARVVEDPAFAERLFDAFLAEPDPMKMSFLQNVLASHARLRNDARWQARFMAVAEADARRERRIAALVFLQQAETIRAVDDRMLALAEGGGELRRYALVALRGLPERRLEDGRLKALCGRVAAADPDPELRGLAMRIEGSPEGAARALSDPDRIVRMHAAHVAGREALERALALEADPEVRALLEARRSGPR
jgi:hypothetical protein